MVFGDYELIQTKRVNHERRNMNVFRRRYNQALGGWSTLYTAAVFGAVGYTFGGVTASELVPTTHAVTSKGGFLKYFSRAGVWVVVPAVVGYGIGIAVFGDVDELRKLGVFQRRYKKEFFEYKRELFYA